MTPHEMYVMEIAENRGIDRHMMLDALGIVSAYGPGRPIRHNRTMTEADEEQAAVLRRQGKPYELIGLMMGFGAETVRTHLKRMGL